MDYSHRPRSAGAAMNKLPDPITSIDALATAIDPWLSHMTWRRDYQSWRERRLLQEQFQGERIAQISRYSGSFVGQHILDLGAGMGGFAVAAALGGARVQVSEYNLPYCHIIQLRADRYGIDVPVLNGAGEHLPYADGTFDLVVCWDVIEHVQIPSAMLAEIHRVLKPGGLLFLTVINRRAWVDPHFHIRGLNWIPRRLAEWYIARIGRSKDNSRFTDMQRLSAMHYYDYPAFCSLAATRGFATTDMNEDALRDGQFISKKPSRRFIRAILRALGIEILAYRAQRAWYVGMFELLLRKEGA